MDNKVINQLHMREMNLNEVLKIIREEESLTRRKLQDLTGFSWGGVSQIVTRLLSQNLIIEVKDTSPGPGRKPTCLQINGEENLLLGVDINSSGITAVIQNLKNEILEQISMSADCSARKKLLANTFQLTDQLFEKYKERKILATGISMQSVVDEKKRVSLYLKECPDWENVPLCDIFEERYKIPAYLAHDPDCLVASNVSMFGEDVLLLPYRLWYRSFCVQKRRFYQRSRNAGNRQDAAENRNRENKNPGSDRFHCRNRKERRNTPDRAEKHRKRQTASAKSNRSAGTDHCQQCTAL